MGYETDLKLFIDGVWKGSDTGHTVVNPVDASTLAEVPYATAADIEEALAASGRAWPEWRSTDVEKRGAILHKTAALLRERADLIAATMTQEQGKPLTEAKLETLASAQLFDWYAEDAKRDYGRTLVRPAGQLSRVIRQPVGPTATFTPWNFPIYLLAKKVSAALAAGCTVISRPPHETPGVATELFRALHDAGRDARVGESAEQLGAAARGLVRRARNDGASSGERGADLLREQVDREIPRGECRGRANRLADHPAELAGGANERSAVVALGVLGVPVEQLRRSEDLELRLAERLALFLRQGRGDEVDALAKQRRGLVEDRPAFLDIHRAPIGPGAVGRRQGLVEVGLGGVGEGGDRLSVGRVDDVVAIAAFARFPHAVDEEFEVCFVSHGAPDKPRLLRLQLDSSSLSPRQRGWGGGGAKR